MGKERVWQVEFWTVVDTDGSRWGMGLTRHSAQERAYAAIVDLYEATGWDMDSDDGEGIMDAAAARAWVERRTVLRIEARFASEAGLGVVQELAHRIVEGLVDERVPRPDRPYLLTRIG